MFADRVAEVLGKAVAERDPEAYAYVQHVLRQAERDAAQRDDARLMATVLQEYASIVNRLAVPGESKRQLLFLLKKASAPKVKICLEVIGGKLNNIANEKKKVLDGEYRESLKKELFALLAE